MFFLYIVLAFICEYVDSSLGMGYGTMLTPLLLFSGLSPLQVVPVILFSEFITGVFGGMFHHKFGNATFNFRNDKEIVNNKYRFLKYLPLSQDAKVCYILLLLGSFGVIFSVLFSVNLPEEVVKLYIGLMVFLIGVYIVFKKKTSKFNWKRFIFIGVLSGFNKGISGGGYGPLVTGGQVITGRNAKNSIGSTSLAEGGICFIGFVLYLLLNNSIDWTLVAPLVIGGVISIPFSVWTVKKIKENRMKMIIGVVTMMLGLLQIIKWSVG